MLVNNIIDNVFVLLPVTVLLIILSVNCSGDGREGSYKSSGDPVINGKNLAEQHCGSCHMHVSPDLLDKETWLNNVLPVMAPKLGIRVWGQNQYYPSQDQSKQAISYNDWISIVNYFKEEAPESLTPSQPPVKLKNGSLKFTIQRPPDEHADLPEAMTTMAKIDTITGNIYTSSATHQSLIQWDKNLEPVTVQKNMSPAVDMTFINSDLNSRRVALTNIGTMLAGDIKRGVFQEILVEQDTVISKQIIAKELNRPLKSYQGDFNNDGRDDWVICEFGHNQGGLYLYEQQKDQTYARKALREVPGSIDATVGDFNNDGWLDLMVLFAYDDEGIWLFTNDKQGGFQQKNLLRFPPVYGSTSFQLIDINRNGLLDIVYTNGDNADFTRVLKPYHGLRIFINQGNYEFEESFFFPINGAFQAIADDFNNNGRIDIVTIAYFADFKNESEETAILFEQVDNLSFEPYALPVSHLGRWIAIDAADINRDGSMDLVLANFSGGLIIQENFTPTWDKTIPFVLLMNNMK